jgi:uncharacterized repeat protein (TIGR01451 family)/LPXTG-motif cell wall-anchored protein
MGVGSAGAQTATLGLHKSVALSPAVAPPGEPFTFVLSYSCSSLSADCVGAKIVDVLPPELSHAAADVKLAGNFRVATYDPTTGTVTFFLFDPLPAGTTAQVAIAVLFPPGTAPGTVAVNRATMSASNASSIISNPVTVTAKAASKWTVSKSVAPGSIAQVDTPLTYRVAFTLAAGGTQNLTNVRFVDTLPTGAVFVSATGGGTFAAPNKVSWVIGNLVPQPNNDVTVTRDVTVTFPSPTFKANDRPLNGVDAFGAPTGSPDQLLGHAERQVILKPSGAVTAGAKTDSVATLGPGQSDTYTITASNPNATPADNFGVLEDLPPQLTMVQDGQPNLTGTGAPPQISVSSGGAFTNLPVSGGGGSWSATAPASTDQVRFSFGTVPAAFSTTIMVRAGIPANGVGRDGQTVVAGQSIVNCADITATSGGVGTPTRHSCTTQSVQPLTVELSKTLTSSPVTSPGQTVSWSIRVAVPVTSATDLVNPAIIDCLPLGLDLVNPLNAADPVNGSVSGFARMPVISRTPNGCGTNQVRIAWTWVGTFTIVRAGSGTFTLNTHVADNAPPGSDVNIVDLSATNLPVPLVRSATLAVTSSSLLIADKAVKGDLDSGFVGFPDVGTTRLGGSAVYQGTVRNVSDVPVTNVVVIDTLPIPGDRGVLEATPRGSQWEPVFAGSVSAPQSSSVSYSASHNPCRPELTTVPPGCQVASWSSSPPGGPSAVGSLKIDYGSMVLNPGQSVSFTFAVNTPSNVPPGAIAWNSFGYTATRVDNLSQLEPAEPQKVGLQVAGGGSAGGPPGISLLKFVNGVHVPNPPGIVINAGSPVVFTYKVTNTASLTLIDITLVDDQIGAITCPKTTLAPGESMVCTSATQVARSGAYVNTAVVTGQPVDSGGNPFGPPLTDLDRGHYDNSLPSTGSNTSLLVLVGGVLLVVGTLMIGAGRSRTRVAAG